MVQPMSDTPPADPAPVPPVTPPPAGGAVPAAGPTDADVKRAATQAKKEAAASMAAELGCTVEEAKSILGQVRAAGDAQKSEAQRMHDAATKAKAEADQVLAAATADRLALRVERKLLAAGVPEGSLARVAKMIAVTSDVDDATIVAEIETLKTDLPGLFAPAPAATGTAPAPGVSPPRPPGQKPTLTGLEAGAARARAEREATTTLDPFSVFRPAGL